MFQNIEAERGRTKMSQERLAVQLGVSKGTIRKWIRGTSEIPGSAIVKMSAMFGCSADYLLGLTDQRNRAS